MKIRCTIRRKNGSTVTLDGITYEWNEGNDHMCEVENPDHQKRLLAVKESFRSVDAIVKADSQEESGDSDQGDDGSEVEQGVDANANGKPEKPRRGRRPAANKEQTA